MTNAIPIAIILLAAAVTYAFFAAIFIGFVLVVFEFIRDYYWFVLGCVAALVIWRMM